MKRLGLNMGNVVDGQARAVWARFVLGIGLVGKWFQNWLRFISSASHKNSEIEGQPVGDCDFVLFLHNTPSRFAVMATKEPRRNSEPPGTDAAVISRTRTQVKRPGMYRVLLLNDDYTPMEFVIAILQNFFNKSLEEATEIMLSVHHNGVGECGVYTYEIAETKVALVMENARKNQHPLQCIMEKK